MSKKKRPHQPGHGTTTWSVNDIRSIIHNPVYAGIGPFPPLIDDTTWIKAQEPLLKQDGAEAVLRQLRVALEQTFNSLPDFMDQPGWMQDAARQCDEQGAGVFFRGFLQALRDAYS